MTRDATVLMPGTCGELIQGTLDGEPFLVSCPIDLFARVRVTLDPTGAVEAPADVPKALAAARAALSFFGCEDLGFRLAIDSPLPRGKGMASSTADVAGTIFAVAAALGRAISPNAVAALALGVEPSDASMFPNVALFDHRHGRRYEDLGPPPPLTIAALAFPGTVDTVVFNQSDRSALLKDTEPDVREALRLVRRGLKERRVELIGRGATLSAEANQRLLFKPQLALVQDIARSAGAVGVTVGHSGTVIGVLVDSKQSCVEAVLHQARAVFPELAETYRCHLVGGGHRLPAGAEPLPVGLHTRLRRE